MNFFFDTQLKNLTEDLVKVIKNAHLDEAAKTADVMAETDKRVITFSVGDEFTGEIVNITPGEMQIRLPDNQIINAQIREQLQAAIGQILRFQVKEQEGNQLYIRPVNENLTIDTMILKALKQANVPVKNNTRELVLALLERNMPVDKNTLQSIYKDMVTYKETNLNTIVSLYKNQIPVSEQTIANMENYQITHTPVMASLSEISEMLSEAAVILIEKNQVEQGCQLLNKLLPSDVMKSIIDCCNMQDGNRAEDPVHELLNQLTHRGENTDSRNNMEAGNYKEDGNNAEIENSDKSSQKSAENSKEASAIKNSMIESYGKSFGAGRENTEKINNASDMKDRYGLNGKDNGIRSVITGRDQINGPDREAGNEPAVHDKYAPTEMGPVQAMKKSGQAFADKTALSQNGKAVLLSLFSHHHFKKYIENEILSKWLITPEELEKENSVSTYQERLHKQMREIIMLTKEDNAFSELNKQLIKANDNMELLHQLNQTSLYMQLPLKFTTQDGNAELYIYADKKAIKNKQNNITAFLHLDLAYLGDLDVYISMKNKNLNVNFYLKKEYLSFVNENIPNLAQSLSEKGYDVHTKLYPQIEKQKVNDKEEDKESLIKQRKKGENQRYSFDIRM